MLIYFDGACEPFNPGGHMGWGIAVVDDDTALEVESGYQAAGPTTSNNVAEYLGVCMALRRAIAAAQAGEREITIRGDSKLVIEQLAGRWGVRDGGLYVATMREAQALLEQLRLLCPAVTIEWLPGSENVHADRASRAELEQRGIKRRGPRAGAAAGPRPQARGRPRGEPSTRRTRSRRSKA